MAGVIAGIIAAIHAFFALFAGHAALPPIATPGQTPSQVVGQVVGLPSTASMSEYTDTDFGFSFWYPTGWTVEGNGVGAAGGPGTHFGDGVVTKWFDVSNGKVRITVQEINSDTRSVHVGNDYYGYNTYYFDTTAHVWMNSSTDAADGAPDSTAPADISVNTMGGLHIFPGGARFGVSSLIPLSARHFLLVTTSDTGGDISQTPLVNTIVATDPSVATPVNAAEQAATIQAEAIAYGVQMPAPVITTKMYTDTTDGFSLDYATSLTPGTNDASWYGALAGVSAQHIVSFTSGPESLAVSMSADPTDVGNCMVAPQSYEEAIGNVSTVQIHGVSFFKYGRGDVAMGQETSTTIYHTLHNNACFEMAVTINSTNPDRLTDDQAAAQTASLKTAAALIDPIVQTFRFTGDASATIPPTCTLSTDTFTYKLGDVMTLTWSSRGATRALWDQAVDQGTGVRTRIVPPQGTPDVSGTARTIANIGGYQSVTLQVVGPGGFGTCSTQVSVSPSNAAPSIMVGSVKVSNDDALTNERNVGVTLAGTATNGALFTGGVNIVLFDPAYQGPYDEASIYGIAFNYDNNSPFYSGGTEPGMRDDSLPFEVWSAKTYLPRGVTSVRVLAYAPFYSSTGSPTNSRTQPILNEVLSVTQ